jgi:acetoin utilization deacetylase AcuC-like enzyme
MGTGVVYTEEFKKHDTGRGHPESAGRVDAVSRALGDTSLAGQLESLALRPAERAEVLLVHYDRLYEEVLESADQDKTFLDADTVASRDTAMVAHLAAGAAIVGVEAVMDERVQNAFAFSRPPGHHAKPDKAMGFCVFNNVAIAAKYALQRHRLSRVLIIDFDVHHGNGTQKAFYTSPEVLYVSTHQSPHYPGTGALDEVGKDDGEGFTLNIPMPAGMGDAEYLRLFRDVIVPVGHEFAPELVLVSAGFDAHRDDPLGGMNVSHNGYAAMTEEILRLARSTCGGRSVFVLEGGYDLAALQKSIVSVLATMTGERAEMSNPGDVAGELLRDVKKAHQPYWKSLSDR